MLRQYLLEIGVGAFFISVNLKDGKAVTGKTASHVR